MTAWENKRTK